MEKKRISESLDDSTSRHLPSLVGDDDTAAVFEESQQGVAQFTQAAGTSGGVNLTLPNPSDEPIIPSRIPNECNTGGIFPESEMESREKKRLRDKAYRERLRLERKKMESDLRMVGKENEDLKRENGLLRSEKDQGLQASAAEIQRLKAEVCGLRGTISRQQVLLDAFSHKQVHCKTMKPLRPLSSSSSPSPPRSTRILKFASLKRRKSNLHRRKIERKIRKLREEMAEIRDEQRCTGEGKVKVRERFEEKQSQPEKLQDETEREKLMKETEIIAKQSISNQMRLDLMFEIIKARSQNDSALVARLTSSLRDLISKPDK